MISGLFRCVPAICLVFVFLNTTPPVTAQEVLLSRDGELPPDGTFSVPFAFYSGTLGPSVGVSIGNRGAIQDQASTFATIVGSASESIYGFLAVRDLSVPGANRLFINAQLNVGSFNEIDMYTDGNPEFSATDEVAGSHDSSEDNFITGDGSDVKLWSVFGVVLPLGDGWSDPESHLRLDEGMVMDDGRDTSVWNPLYSGYTVLGMKPFYRNQDVDIEEGGKQENVTAGTELFLHHEHTDFHENPGRGSVQAIRYSRDWGEMESSAPWETLECELTKYCSLTPSDSSRHRVLALTAWWIDTLSWDDVSETDGVGVYDRPPAYAGASLGGLDRMRAYPEGRFHDRAASYYSAEYRHVPYWNPLGEFGWLNRRNAHVQWMQYVLGVEAGRVAPEFDWDELHRDMKVDVILGLRAMVNTLVVRADMGVGDEGMGVQMTVDQPF